MRCVPVSFSSPFPFFSFLSHSLFVSFLLLLCRVGVLGATSKHRAQVQVERRRRLALDCQFAWLARRLDNQRRAARPVLRAHERKLSARLRRQVSPRRGRRRACGDERSARGWQNAASAACAQSPPRRRHSVGPAEHSRVSISRHARASFASQSHASASSTASVASAWRDARKGAGGDAGAWRDAAKADFAETRNAAASRCAGPRSAAAACAPAAKATSAQRSQAICASSCKAICASSCQAECASSCKAECASSGQAECAESDKAECAAQDVGGWCRSAAAGRLGETADAGGTRLLCAPRHQVDELGATEVASTFLGKK